MKQQIEFQSSKLSGKQLADLVEATGMSEAEVINLALDRMYREVFQEKEIYFTFSRERAAAEYPDRPVTQGLTGEKRTVNLTKLSHNARRLAQKTSTTDNNSELGEVRVMLYQTYRELYEENWNKAVFPKEENQTLEGYIHNISRSSVINLYDHPIKVWRWDNLQKDESPEEYFERHAAAIQRIGEIL